MLRANFEILQRVYVHSYIRKFSFLFICILICCCRISMSYFLRSCNVPCLCPCSINVVSMPMHSSSLYLRVLQHIIAYVMTIQNFSALAQTKLRQETFHHLSIIIIVPMECHELMVLK